MLPRESLVSSSHTGRRKETADQRHHLRPLRLGHSRLETGTRAYKHGKKTRAPFRSIPRRASLANWTGTREHVNWFHSQKCEDDARVHSRLLHRHGNCLGVPGHRTRSIRSLCHLSGTSPVSKTSVYRPCEFDRQIDRVVQL